MILIPTFFIHVLNLELLESMATPQTWQTTLLSWISWGGCFLPSTWYSTLNSDGGHHIIQFLWFMWTTPHHVTIFDTATKEHRVPFVLIYSSLIFPIGVMSKLILFCIDSLEVLIQSIIFSPLHSLMTWFISQIS